MAVDDRKPLGQSDAGATPAVASSVPAAPAPPASPAEDARSSASGEELLRTAADSALTEDRFLALLKRGDLPAEVLERLAENSAALKLQKVKLALATIVPLRGPFPFPS